MNEKKYTPLQSYIFRSVNVWAWLNAVIKLSREPRWRSALYTVNVNVMYIASYETLKYI